MNDDTFFVYLCQCSCTFASISTRIPLVFAAGNLKHIVQTEVGKIQYQFGSAGVDFEFTVIPMSVISKILNVQEK